MRRLLRAEHMTEQSNVLRAVSWLVLLFALVAIIQFLAVAYIRLFYPFELEWIEGASIDYIQWILKGHFLYGEPTLSFVPMVYSPLYFYLSAVVTKVIGIGFVAPRLVSILSTLGCFLMLFLIVTRDSGHPIPGLLAAGLYAAAFRFAGAWMDIAKPDSMFLFLILAAFFVGCRYPNYCGMATSGLLYVLAYYTKQNALPLVLMMAPLSLAGSQGRTWLQWLIVVVAGLVIFWALDVTSQGWFSFYTFDMVTYHERATDVWFFLRSTIRQMWPAILVGLSYPVATLTTIKADLAPRVEGVWHNLSLGCALTLIGWSVFLQRWTYANGFMPACAGLGLLAGLGYGRGLKLMRWSPGHIASIFTGGASALLLFQFAALFYNPLAQLPTEQSRQTWEQFVVYLRDLSGETLVFNHGFVSYLAGKSPYLHNAPYADAAGGGAYPPRTEDNRWRREKTRQVLERAITQQVFNWVVAGEPTTGWLPYYIATNQEPVIFRPATGPPGKPEYFLYRNPVARGGSLPLTDTSFDSLLKEGWSIPEEWGRWAVGQRSVVQVALEQGYDYELTIEAFPFCPPQFSGQTIKVGWNDLALGKRVFTTCERHPITFDIPAEAITKDLNTLSFKFEKATSPADVGLSGDPRPLAVGFASITFVQREG